MTAEVLQSPQPRPLWVLLRELDSVATDMFWIWWFGLSKLDRRTLMSAMDDAAETFMDGRKA